MRTLVFGGTGFIGSALTERLASETAEVVCADIETDASFDAGNVEVVEADVTDRGRVDELVAAVAPDRIVSLAALLGAESDEHPSEAIRVNCVGTDNVFRAAVDHGVDRVTYASSIVAYGGPDAYETTVTEEAQSPAVYTQYPVLFYSATKQMNEYQARLYADASETEFAAVRPGIVFGPGREGGLTQWASDFVTDPASGRPGHIPYRPDQRLSMVYRDDVAELFTTVTLADKTPHHAYNTGGHTVTARDLAATVEDEFGVEVTTDETAAEPPLVADVSHDRARETFGYDLTPLRECLREHARDAGEP